MKCCNCDKNAMYAVGPEGQQVSLCLDCYIRWQNIELQQQEIYERQINFLTDEIESVVGMHGILPRYPERRAVIHTGGIILNNIHVTNSEIGVLNTGTIENVDSTVTVLKTAGNAELANAITALTEAVIKSTEISVNQKDQALELLGTLSEEAVAPKEKRKLAVVRVLLSELSGVLGGVASLAQVWEKVRTIFQQVFSI